MISSRCRIRITWHFAILLLMAHGFSLVITSVFRSSMKVELFFGRNYFDGIKHMPGMMVLDTVSMAACGINQSPISINIVDDTQYHQSWQQFPTVGYSAPNDTLSSAAVAGLPVNDLCMLLVSSGNIE